MKSVFLILDSLNRRMLPSYGGGDLIAPNFRRLADRAVTFDNHYCGSLPCMPARREMMTGRHHFLEAPWGPLEPWDLCFPSILRSECGTYSHLITDNYHYFHSGGEGYHTLFDSYELERGQEGDMWRPLVNAPARPDRPALKPEHARFYAANRAFQDSEDEESYSTPRCFSRAIDFLDHNHDADNWFLELDLFDPHEPFDCPKKYLELYHDRWDRRSYTWPDYLPIEQAKDDPAAVAHIRNCYAATVTMADVWLGKMLDAFDRYDLWKDTALIVTTDHGYLLGEHGYWAKNYMFDYREIVHIPLFVWAPPGVRAPAGELGDGAMNDAGGARSARGARASVGGRGNTEAPRHEQALTATIDLAPTFLEWYGAKTPDGAHGVSLARLFAGDAAHATIDRATTATTRGSRSSALHRLHDGVLYGYFGKDIGMFDGRYTYCRQPLPDSVAFHHTAMPRGFRDFIDAKTLAAAEHGVFLPHARGIAHFRIPVASHRHHGAPDFNPIYDLDNDPHQERPLQDSALETNLAEAMKELLVRYGAPAGQLTRTGLG